MLGVFFYNLYMSIEVEIKAWIDHFDKTLTCLKDRYSFVKEYIKEDIYLEGVDARSGQLKEVRLRRSGNRSIVTFKERSHRDKVEVNIEKEFMVDSPENFLYVINQLGYREYITKSKVGFHFICNGINIELSHVKGLGDFIEIESIVEHDTDVDGATDSIYRILDDLEIPRKNIEDRFYVQMLKEGKVGE